MEVQSSTDTSSAVSSVVSTYDDSLDKEAFLELLVTQLRYQNPLDPMDNTEFIGQLAQFSSLEQLTNINETIEGQEDVIQALDNTMMTNLIGREVMASEEVYQYSETNTSSMGFELPVSASIEVTISDSDGNKIKTIDMGELTAGSYLIDWDGTDSDGSTVAAGDYTYAIEATSADGETATVTSYLVGTITGMRFVDGVPVMFVGEQPVYPSQIVSIYDSEDVSG